MSETGSNLKGSDFCNLEYLLVHLGRNRAAAERLIHIFLESAPTLCLRLEKAATEDDLAALKNVLHDIRSSCILFSGNKCLDQTREMEQIVREQLLESKGNDCAPDWQSRAALLIQCIQCMAVELKGFLLEREG